MYQSADKQLTSTSTNRVNNSYRKYFVDAFVVIIVVKTYVQSATDELSFVHV